jgi:hypothetical protein
MVDILHRTDNGWEIYEVKSSTGVRDIYIDDAAIQYFVVKNSGLEVEKVSVVHINNRYVRETGDVSIKELFSISNITKDVLQRQKFIPEHLHKFEYCLEDKEREPDIDIGTQCTKPYVCDAYEYCWKTQRGIPDYSIFNVFNMGKKPIELYRQGIINVEDIPENLLTTEKQKLEVNTYKNNYQFIDKNSISEFLSSLTYPIYHLDFETYQKAIPEIPGTRPYQQIPYQFSLHIEQQNGDLEHIEFLADEYDDPREKLINKMLAHITCRSTVLVYNESFEKTRIKELARDFPLYADKLLSINYMIKDLATPFSKKFYYHPDLKGKFSIKAVMPHLVPEMARAYKNLKLVQNGGDAMNIFPKLIDMSPHERARYRVALLKYCELDTLSMVMVLRALKKLV